mgnify:CR=1 FL=1
MIEQLKGVVENKNDSFLILSINGFGLKLLMSKNGIESMPYVGKEVLVLTYLHVKEDALDLFGFYSIVQYLVSVCILYYLYHIIRYIEYI